MVGPVEAPPWVGRGLDNGTVTDVADVTHEVRLCTRTEIADAWPSGMGAVGDTGDKIHPAALLQAPFSLAERHNHATAPHRSSNGRMS